MFQKNIKKYFQKIKNTAIHHWVITIITIVIFAFIINLLFFFPGYMSNDSILMYYVAKGATPSDLAPVMLGLVWRVLYKLTGQISSLLFLQLSMLWLSLGLLALYVYKKTSSKLFSIICLAVGFLPFIFNISGVIWRDCQMAFSLLLSTVLLLYLDRIMSKKWRIVLIIVIILLLFYAVVSRYNAIIAVVPMMYIVITKTKIFKKIYFPILLSLLTIPIAFFVLIPAINYSVSATKSNNQPGLMLDDIIEVSNTKILNNIKMPAELRESLIQIQKCSNEKDILIDNMNFCGTVETRFVLYENHSEFPRIWQEVIYYNIDKYLLYKTNMYLNVLVPIKSYSYIWQRGIVKNDYNETIKFKGLEFVGFAYVQTSGRYLRAFFEPWFWMLVGSILLFLSIKRKGEHKYIINTLCISGLLYVIGYIPTGVAPDYRYIYWTVIATIIAFILYIVDNKKTIKK